MNEQKEKEKEDKEKEEKEKERFRVMKIFLLCIVLTRVSKLNNVTTIYNQTSSKKTS